jgi:hypothetical protein
MSNSPIVEISTVDIPTILDIHFSTPGAPVPFLHGKPGVSKSSQAKAVAARKGYKFIDIRLAQMSAMDVRGLPVINHSEKSTEWFRPDFFPTEESVARFKKEGYTGCVMFFDELSSAPGAIQAAAYQIILDRATGQYSIPEDPEFPIVMAAAGNNLKDGAVVLNMSSALKNRMSHYQVNVDLDGFVTYGLETGMDSRVLAYLKFTPDALHVMPQNGEYAFPSNRTWEFTSNLIKGRKLDSTLKTIIAGTIGVGVAESFAAHMKIADQLPDIDEVLEHGPVTNIDPKDNSLVWTYVMGLTGRMITKGNNVDDKHITNFVKAIGNLSKSGRTEFMYLALHEVSNMRDKKPMAKYMRNKEWAQVIKDNMKLLTSVN